MKKRTVALLLALVLVIGCAIGGTVAWLIDSSDTVTNTFTAGDINITLAETVDSDFKIIPGTEEYKDPVLTVIGGSEDCYVFIQVKEVNNDDDYVTWGIDTAVWSELSTDGNVTTYYAKTNYTTQDSDKEYNVIANQKVSYADTLTKTDLANITDSNKPQLVFKGFAVQTEAGATAADAWATVSAGDKLS